MRRRSRGPELLSRGRRVTDETADRPWGFPTHSSIIHEACRPQASISPQAAVNNAASSSWRV